ncbi:hypothetical protein BJY04DRAFT_214304 [Aspergillus karnatakaensis]|uniref:uncharacterized protein n=1 Tax=Aspergillus karnatakaensis TaxID=1810916 RepID=UPI003CCCD79A
MSSTQPQTDTTFTHWLLYYSWHWALLLVYALWFEESYLIGSNPRRTPDEQTTPPNNPRVTLWLERKGHLRSEKDARSLLGFHIVLLLLEPIEGYWILTAWYRTFLRVYSMSVPKHYTWIDRVAKYWCTFLLPAGLVAWVLVGAVLVVWTWLHVWELWKWRDGDYEHQGEKEGVLASSRSDKRSG